MNEIKNKNGLTENEFLKKYKPSDYERPSVTVDTLLFTVDKDKKDSNLKILLIKRDDHPYINCWALPGGFVNIDEGIEDAAYRELKEETNICDDVYLEQLYTFGNNPNRDPRMRIITCAYMSLTSPNNIKKTKAGDDAKDALWFNIRKDCVDKDSQSITWLLSLTNKERNIRIEYIVKDAVENGKLKTTIMKSANSTDTLAFDHYESINMAMDRMRNKVDYSPIAFNLLPSEFTLTELQSVYEILLGTSLEKSNFRKKIKHMVIETEKDNKGEVNHRPAKYYRFNPFYK